MKKVLALVLAVIMVCTMAFAVTVNEYADNAYVGTTTDPTPILPGKVIYFTVTDLAGAAGAYKDAQTHEFVPANNKVTVSYGAGADLVKSQGWVLVNNVSDAQGKPDKTDLSNWQYQIALKDNDSAVVDKNVDFAIAKVTFKATGEEMKSYIFDGKLAADGVTYADGHVAKYERDYGYPTGTYVLNKLNATSQLNAIFVNQDKIYTVVAGTDNGEALNSLTIKNVSNFDYVTYTLNAGQKVLRKEMAPINTAELTAKNGYNAAMSTGMPAVAVNDTNLTGSAVVTNWNKAWNAYAVAADGKTVTVLPVSVEDGVATIKVPAYSAVAVINGTLTNVKAAAAAAPEVTNPGTGANDVVGVAAALAVVALVSGAAISLKK